MDIKELQSFQLSDAVKFHDHLNPKIFHGQHIRPEVEKQLKIIVGDFLEELGVNGLDVHDITISGSNAAYSYTPHSDLDLHILVDMTKLNHDELYRELFTAKKNAYNDSHDIRIYGIPVELYIQDSSEPVISLGEYSIKNNKWLKIPSKRRANFDQTVARKKYEKILAVIERAMKTQKIDRVQNVLHTIKRYRQAGLDKGGEFSPENLAYKALRSQGWLTALYKLRDELHSKELSIEGMYAEHSKFLSKHTPTVEQLVIKYKVPKQDILIQLDKGIKVELEHTKDRSIAREIALDHINEDPHYYNKLARVGLEESRNTYKEIEFVCANPEFPDATDPELQHKLFSELKKIPGVIPLFQDQSHYSEGQRSLTAIYKDPNIKTFILKLAKSLGVGVDLIQPVSDDYVDRAIRGEIEGQINESSGYIPSEKEKNDPRFKTALTVDVKPDSIKKNAKSFYWKTSRAGIPPTANPNGKF
jgi:DNA-binding phage protein